MDENIELKFIDSNIRSMAEVLTEEDPNYQNEVKDIDESIQALYEKKAEIKMRYIKLKKREYFGYIEKRYELKSHSLHTALWSYII